jgi:hypothetical protein
MSIERQNDWLRLIYDTHQNCDTRIHRNISEKSKDDLRLLTKKGKKLMNGFWSKTIENRLAFRDHLL